MIIKYWERDEVRAEALKIGEMYEQYILRNDANPKDLWTHMGDGFFIGSWHPNGRIPSVPKSIGGHRVRNQHLPHKMTFPGPKGSTLRSIPNIRILKTLTKPEASAELINRLEHVGTQYSVGWRGVDLAGMVMQALPVVGCEYEFTPYDSDQKYTAKLESGESGGPSFNLDRLQGIHRGPGGRREDGAWISGVDVWLGEPQIHDWIMAVIGSQKQQQPPAQAEKLDDIIVKAKPGQRVIVEVEP